MHGFTSRAPKARGLAFVLTLLIIGQAAAAFAHEEPPGCTGTGVSITLTIYRADGTTPVGSGRIEDDETIVYKTKLGLPADACAFEGGSISITPPGSAGEIDVTPSGGVPCIGPGVGCQAGVESLPLSYVVSHADETPAGSLLRVTAATRYGGGYIHDGDPDGEGPTATTTRTTAVAHPDLHLVKTPDAGIVNAGSDAVFTLTTINAGLGSAKAVEIDDDLPASPGDLSWSVTDPDCAITDGHLHCAIGTLAAGASHVVVATSPVSHLNKGQINNLACATTSSHETHGTADAAGDNCDSADINITAPLLEITKTADASPVSNGTQIGFTINVANTGDGTATAATLNDVLPVGPGIVWSIDSVTGPGTCGISSGVLSCAFGDLASGGTASIHIVSPTNQDSEGLYSNTATVTATNAVLASATATVEVLAPGLSVTKTADASPVSAQDDIGFSIEVTNNGQGTSTGVTLNDPLPGGDGVEWSVDYSGPGSCSVTGSAPLQTLSCSFGDLASGSSVGLHLSSQTNTFSGGSYPNTVTVESTNGKAPVTASATIIVLPVTLAITKTADDAVVSNGDQIGFSIVVTNVGPGIARSVTLDDPLPGGSGIVWSTTSAGCSVSGGPSQVLSCSFGDLAVGESKTAHVTSPTGATSEGEYDNTATTSATNSGDATASATVLVQPAPLAVFKTADDASVSTTEDIGFTVTASNAGPGVARDVALNDPLPAGPGLDWFISPAYAGPGTCSVSGAPGAQTLSCSFGDMAASSLTSVHVSSHTTPDSAGTYTNVATLSSLNTPLPIAADATTIVLAPDLTITKVADAPSVSTTQPIGFTIAVVNDGTGKSFNSTISDPLPGGAGISWSISPAYAGPGSCAISGPAGSQVLECSLGTLAPGAGTTVHVRSNTTRKSAGTYGNTATAAGSNNSPVTAADSIDVLAPHLVIAKNADAAQVYAGEGIGYTITVTNDGEGTALGATLADPLPGNDDFNWGVVGYAGPGTCAVAGTAPIQNLSCALGDLAPGASVTIHVTTTTTHVCDGVYENVATVAAINDGPLAASATIEILKSGLAITNLPDAPTVRGGTTIGLTATVSNAGPGKVFSAVLNEALPAGPGLSWKISPAYSGPGSCSISSGTLNCSFGDLDKDATATVHVTSVTSAASKGLYTATAKTRGQNNDIQSATAAVDVLGVPVPTLTTTNCAKLVPGGSATLTITGGNAGNAIATNAAIRVSLPDGLDVIDANDGTVSADGRTVEWEIGDLLVGKSVKHTLTVGVSAKSGVTLSIGVTLRTDEVPAASKTLKPYVTLAGAQTHGNARAWNPTYFGQPFETTYDINTAAKSQADKPGKERKDEWDGINLWTNIQGPIAMRHWHADSRSQVEQTVSHSHALSYLNDVNVLYGAITAQEVRAEASSSANASGASSTFAGSHFVDLKINGTPVASSPAPNATYALYSPVDPTFLIGSVVLNEQSSSTSGTTTSNSITMIHVKLIHSFMGMPPGFELVISKAASDASFPDGKSCA